MSEGQDICTRDTSCEDTSREDTAYEESTCEDTAYEDTSESEYTTWHIIAHHVRITNEMEAKENFGTISIS